jgi:hypothetical protein
MKNIFKKYIKVESKLGATKKEMLEECSILAIQNECIVKCEFNADLYIFNPDEFYEIIEENKESLVKCDEPPSEREKPIPRPKRPQKETRVI